MNRRTAATISLLVMIALTSAPSYAQTAPQWTPQERTASLDTIEHAINNYYYPSRVPAIRAFLEARRSSIVAIDGPELFAKTVTAYLQAASGDKHFVVWYSKDADQNQSTQYSASEKAALARFFRYVGNGYRVAARLQGNVGYLRLSGFGNMPGAKATVDSAMILVAPTDALIVDMRENQGGDSDTVDYLLGYFFAKSIEIAQTTTRTNGTFVVHHESTSPMVSGPRYLNRPLYVLVDKATISAGEMFAYSLQSVRRAVVVGARTAGAANGLGSPPVFVSAHLRLSVPDTHIVNPTTHANWERGVVPDVAVRANDALLTAYRRALGRVPTSYDPLGERAAALRNPAQALQQSLPKT